MSDYRSDPGRLGYRAASVLTSPPALDRCGRELSPCKGQWRWPLPETKVTDESDSSRSGAKVLNCHPASADEAAAEFPCPLAIIADGAPASSRAFQKPGGGRPRLVGDRRAGEHTGDFLAPCFLFEN